MVCSQEFWYVLHDLDVKLEQSENEESLKILNAKTDQNFKVARYDKLYTAFFNRLIGTFYSPSPSKGTKQVLPTQQRVPKRFQNNKNHWQLKSFIPGPSKSPCKWSASLTQNSQSQFSLSSTQGEFPGWVTIQA